MDKRITVRGEIGREVTLDNFKESINDIKEGDALTVDISSQGGSVLVGFEIFNEVQNLPTKDVTFEINGFAGSIASIIIMSGAKVHASEVSLLMIHKASTGVEGNSIELTKQVEVLNKIDELLVNTYYDRNQAKGEKKLGREDIVKMLEAETWFTPTEALQYGFIDKIIPTTTTANSKKEQAVVNSYVEKLMANYNPKMKHLEKLKALLRNAGKVQLTQEDVNTAVETALGGKAYSSLSEEEQNQFLVQVKASLEEKLGGTMTEEEATQINEWLNQAVMAMQEKVESETVQAKLTQANKSIQELKDLVETMAKNNIDQATRFDNLERELSNVKASTRTFGKRPFVNESTRLNIGSAYVDPYAKHRQQMEEIDKKTRP